MKIKNKILLIGLVIFQAVQLNATGKLSLYDPYGALSYEERSRIEAEGRTVTANRKVNGQDLLIQIDFMSEDEFDAGGVIRQDDNGRALFSLGTYAKWSTRYFSQPAVLMLFIDQGGGNYKLDALNFSEMLMDRGIPDLVRRYIRDEIMKKETSYVETISSGLYAIGEALNPIYKQRLEKKGIEMLNTDDRYQRAHCNHWSDCKYYEYYPIERLRSSFPANIDFNEIGFFIETPSDYEPTNLISATQQKILDWGYTHASEIVSNWPWENRGKYLKTSTNTAGYTIPPDYFPLKNSGDTLSFFDVEVEQKSNGEMLPVMGYLQIHGWKATYCNFFAYDLSRYIFGHVPWGTPKRANDIHEYILNHPESFIEIEARDVFQFSDVGFAIYYTQFGTLNPNQPSGRNPGHIATAWIEEGLIIQAGDDTGIYDPGPIFNPDRLKIHVYLGFLKK